MSTLVHRRRSAFVVAVQTPTDSDLQLQASLAELTQLLEGLNIDVRGRLVQKRASTAGNALLGEGKLQELSECMRAAPDVELVVVDAELSPSQERLLELATSAEILDRTAVILRIFEQRARTPEARLEVELAGLLHALPRVRDDHSLGDREGGGGRAGRGHSNVELAKQRHRERIASIRKQLAAKEQTTKLRRRQQQGARSVVLIGYTNAGKSSLMRQLTASEVHVKDAPFATLATTIRRLHPPAKPPILVADTVGFIRRLPHALVASFRSTLDEVEQAALLLCVVDATDESLVEQLEVTRRVVAELGAADTPVWLLLNKIDRCSAQQREQLREAYPEAIQLSAHAAVDIDALHARITSFFDQQLVAAQLEIPYKKQGLLAEFRDQLHVESEQYGSQLEVIVRAPPEVIAKLRAKLKTTE
jgi:GTP-binding protein HflX